MPRQDRYEDNMMMRDSRQRERGYGRSYGDPSWRDNDRGRGRDSAAFFGSESRSRDNDRHSMGGWGERDRERDRSSEEQGYGADDHNRGVPMDETRKLIASNKVEGTPVYDRHGDKLGTIHNFMVDKRKGNVVYAVLKHGGGFLGLNERYYPMEWDQLTYDTQLDGYHVRMTEDDLRNFGSFDSDGRWHRRSSDRNSERSERDRGYSDYGRSRRDNERDFW